MKKLKKLTNHPGIFFRDFLNKKYPVTNGEQLVIEEHEALLIENDLKLSSFESNINKTKFPVDVVFTWVDNSDPNWQDKYQNCIKEISYEGLYNNDIARFNNHNELYYSIYSVKKFMPWVRNIYIVTDNQLPTWLNNDNNDNIFIINHTEIIEHQYLPTFNSHVIEANLHKIPNLSENFIYFNDDVFVARPLSKEHFFRPNGIASIFLSGKTLNAMKKKGVMTPTLFASFNSINLLNRHYDIYLDRPLVHTYVPLKKSMYQLAWKLYEHEINCFLSNQLRSNDDLNMATFLIPWLTYCEGKAVSTREICYYFNIRSADAPAKYTKLLRNNGIGKQPHSFCANDFNSTHNIINYQENLISTLRKYYQI
ncbi:stealth family protein [Neisseria zalophi]|uniref:Capsule biosynthesis protein CapC n=1 Tax=Neisseria zalophi TaxID=640030 RepID=A0A5J6PXR2_9NEIS|nr:stealth family protein [Neisseria zalophi]QEY25647.1 capsule biosynthesis protein CapC [Neisseria zalophi]